LLKRLAAVTRAWTTRRLLWLWTFAYACVLTSAFLWPVSPKDTYFQCPEFLLPSDAADLATDVFGPDGQPRTFQNPALIVRPGVGSYAYRLRGSAHRDNVDAVRAALDNLPNLERIYIGGYNDAVHFQRVRDRLPGIRVWHLELNGGRLASTLFLLLATLTLGGAVLQQSQAFFSLPQARIFPRYVAPHLLFLGMISGLGIVVATLIAGNYGDDLWAAAAVQVFAWGAWSAFDFRVLALPGSPFGSRRFARIAGNRPAARTPVAGGQFGGAVLLAAATVCCGIFIARPYVLESYLLGELPWLTAAFLLTGGILGGAVALRMPAYCVTMSEVGATPILSLQDMEKRRVERGVLPIRFERRLDRLRRRGRMPAWLWQIRAMHSGNPDLLMPVVVRIVAPIVLVVLLDHFWPSSLFPWPSRLFSTLLVGLLLAAGWLISLSHIFSNWWQRRKTFSVQLLYPWTRGQLARAAFVAYVFDVLGILAVLLATLTFCDVALRWRLEMPLIRLGSLAIALAAALLVTGGLWLLTLRHRMLASFLAVGGVLLLCAAMTVAGRLVMDHESHWRIALPFAFLSCVFGFDAWRRWMRSEWGLFGP
jgi:hypothetical protein